MTELRFDDRVVIVTGAGNGLGKCHALEFARRGARVVVNDLGTSAQGDGTNRRTAQLVADEIIAAGGEAVASQDSVTEGARIVDAALDNFGRIDIIIHNAGVLRDKSFGNMSEEDWDIIQQVHGKGAFSITRAAWPHLRGQGFGRLVFTSSAAGLYGNFGQANYSMAKLGLHGLAQTLAIEGQKHNIHANTIAPMALSRLTAQLLPPALQAKLKPELITPLVIRLCAEHNTSTGQLFEAGAGWMGALRWERAQGKQFASQHLSAEEVDAAWSQLGDFTNADHPSSCQEALAAMLAKQP